MGMIMHDDVPYGEGTSYTQGTGIAINNNIIAVDADNTPTKNSEKPVKSKGVYSALESNRDESTSLLKSTVGWTGKNLLPNDFTNQIINGVTCTKDVNGIINLNGICTGDTYRRIYISNIPNGTYIISDNVQNHSDCSMYVNATKLDGTTVYNIANTINKPTLNADNTLYKEYDIGLYLKNGIQFSNLKVYPMLRDASITDDTYEPYHESVEEEIEQIYADNGVLGAKNLLPNNATSRTITGITFTVNADGTITANGTATADANFTIANAISVNEPMILSGCPKNGSDSTYRLIAQVGSSYLKDYGEGLLIDSNITQIYIQIKSGQTVNNLVFKPMLRLASDPDDNYVPYAMTNRELTDSRDVWTATATVSSSGTVTFSGLNDSYSYSRPYYDLPSGDSAYTYSKVTKSGSGTSVTLTYTTNAPIGTVCKLRILK